MTPEGPFTYSTWLCRNVLFITDMEKFAWKPIRTGLVFAEETGWIGVVQDGEFHPTSAFSHTTPVKNNLSY